MSTQATKYVSDVQSDRVLLGVLGQPLPDDWPPPAATDLGDGLLAVPIPAGGHVGSLLELLRDRGFAFLGVPHGWPPAAVFEQLRDAGKVSGKYDAISFSAPGRWHVRQAV